MVTDGAPHMLIEAQVCLDVCALPPRIACLINPRVLALRAAAVKARINDESGARVRRRRCAEIITKNLLEEHEDLS